MPNQPSADKTLVGTRLPNDLVAAVDACVTADETSRTAVVETALREYLLRRELLVDK